MKINRIFGIATSLAFLLSGSPKINAGTIVNGSEQVFNGNYWNDGKTPYISGYGELGDPIGDYMKREGVKELPSGFYAVRAYGYTITVPEGSNLYKLASELSRRIGNKVSWQKLWKENEHVIGHNPHLIKPRMKLEHAVNYVETQVL